MKCLAGFWLLALIALPVLAVEKPTRVVVDGKAILDIQDVHVTSGGRVVILYPGGGTTVAPDKLPAAFLQSWGITAQSLDESKKDQARQSEESLNQAIRAGLFREVDGVIYDLRKPQAGWVQFSSAKVLQAVGNSAIFEISPPQPNRAPVMIRNLPGIVSENDRVTIMAKLTDNFNYLTREGTRTGRSYDAGRICARSEIPDSILKDGQPWASIGFRSRPTERPDTFPRAGLPDQQHLRAIGSGFFVTADGYLLTNNHVVKGASHLKVKCKDEYFDAAVVEVNETDDVALLKVSGGPFKPLSLSRKPSADLGEEVFTIGFPNIDVQGLEPKYTDGKISSLAGLTDDPREYQISVPVQPGNSGGPLCDSQGKVVGIVVARLNDMEVLRSSGSLPQNVNYAVKASRALNLLQSVPRLSLPQETNAGHPAGVVQSVEDSIAMILVY